MCRNDELSWLFTNRFRATRYMKVKRMGITEILRRIWLFSANKTKSSEFISKQPTQLIVKLNSSLRQIIVTYVCDQTQKFLYFTEKDSCSGDGGGPLFAKEPKVSYQIRLVSYGTNLCGRGIPGVYTKVAAYLAWIESKMEV